MAATRPPAYALSDDDLLSTCTVERHHSGGPGGQHANRTNSAIRLVHRETGVSATASDQRDQHTNKRIALRRLRLNLACSQRGNSDPAWVASRRQGKRLPIGAAAGGYHLVAAALLDALAGHHADPASAAAVLGISTSQLVKVVAAEKSVLAAANQLRDQAGLAPLRASR